MAITDIPRNPDNTVDPASWGETGGTTSTADKAVGFTLNQVPASASLNYAPQTNARYARAAFHRGARADEALFDSWAPDMGSTWMDGTNPLDVYLDSLAAPGTSRAVDVWVLPATGAANPGAVRTVVDIPKGAPITLLGGRTNWISVPDTLEVTTGADVIIKAVGLGSPDPGADPGFVTVWSIDTDAVSITGQTSELPPIPVLLTIAMREAIVGGDLKVDGTLNACGNVSLGDNTGDTIGVGGGTADQVSAKGPVDFFDDATILAGSDWIINSGGSFDVQRPLKLTAAATTGASELTVNGDAQIVFREGATDERMHLSEPGFMYVELESLSATSLGATKTLTLLNPVLPPEKAAGQVRVTYWGEVQGDTAGKVTLELLQSDDDITYTTVSTTVDRDVPSNSSTSNWYDARISRRYNYVDANPRYFQFKATADGVAVTCRLRSSLITIEAI